MFVVYAGVKHSDNNAFTDVISLIGRFCVDLGRSRTSGFSCDIIHGNHDVLHLDNDHPIRCVNVHQGADGDFVKSD